MGRDYKASVSPGKAHQVLKLHCPVVLLLKRGRSAIADLPSCDFRCWLFSHSYKPTYLGVSTVTMSRNLRTRPDEKPSSGATGRDGTTRLTWHKMHPLEAVARDVYCAPIAITGLEHLPRHIPKKRFDELCDDHGIPVYANAVHIIRLWNAAIWYRTMKRLGRLGLISRASWPGFWKRKWDHKTSGPCSGNRPAPQSKRIEICMPYGS